jgi:peptidyl-prolyl cis-trans isomerase C
MQHLSRALIIVASLVAVPPLAIAAGNAAPEAKAVSAPAPETPAKAEAQKPAKQTSPQDPVARINGTVITRGELSRAVKALMAQNPQSGTLSPELMKQAESSTLDNLIAAELLYQAGSKLTIKDLDKQVDDKFTQSKARFTSPAEFEKALKANDINEKELREYTRKDIIINSLVNTEIAPAIKITDEDIKKFYTENVDRFKRPESVKASHILIGVDQKATPEEKQKARAKADEILKKLKSGGDFAALAKSDSTCPSKAQGGDLGFFSRGQMVPPFEKAAFAMKPGELSEVVETQFGYHIIKVTDKQAEETTKFEEVKDKIRDYLKGQKMQQAIAAHITTLRGKAKVEILKD